MSSESPKGPNVYSVLGAPFCRACIQKDHPDARFGGDDPSEWTVKADVPEEYQINLNHLDKEKSFYGPFFYMCSTLGGEPLPCRNVQFGRCLSEGGGE